MALFRRRQRSTPPAPHPRPAAAPPDGRPWLDHGLADGDLVECARCHTALEVRLATRTSVTVSHDDALAGTALVCTSCGRLLCADCGLAASDNPYLPKCDGCRGHLTLPMTP